MKEKLRKTVTGGLLAFVLISIGFALGKRAALRSAQKNSAGQSGNPAKTEDKVIVYYVHATKRCATCNRIEQMAKKIVETRFKEDLAAGRLEWHTADFQKKTDIAEKYNIIFSSVVIVKISKGRETGFRNLQEVWLLNGQPDKFSTYVGDAIAESLEDNRP